jgi:hypothetical protein
MGGTRQYVTMFLDQLQPAIENEDIQINKKIRRTSPITEFIWKNVLGLLTIKYEVF